MDNSLDTITPIASSDKIEQVLAALHRLIIDGNLKPGTELPAERELAAQLKVSRFSLREALRAAQAQGLIDIKRGKKPTVTVPSAAAAAEVMRLTLRRSKKPFTDLIIARQGLEYQIVKLAAVNAKQEHIDAMEATITAMEEQKEILALCTEKDIEFHSVLLEASDNAVFEIMLASVSELLKKARAATLEYRGIDIAIRSHKEILEAVKNHDPDKAAQAMARHLETTAETVKELERLHIEAEG